MSALGIPDRNPGTGQAATIRALGCPGGGPLPSRRRRGTGLRSQLVFTALLAALLPVLLTGGLATLLLAERPGIAEFVQDPTKRTEAAARLDGFLAARIAEARTWASAPAIVRAVRDAEPVEFAEVLAEILARRPDGRLPVADGSDPRAEADSFLHRRLAAAPWLERVSLIDRHGLIVASTAPEGRSPPSAEPWWRAAWREGIAVGQFRHVGTDGLASLGLSVRIDDPRGGPPLGVLRTVLVLSPFPNTANGTAPPVAAGRFATANPDGMLAATTGPHRARIVNASAGIVDPGGLPVGTGRVTGRAGFPVDGRGLDTPPDAVPFASWVDRFGLGHETLRGIAARIPDPAVLAAGIRAALADGRVRAALALAAVATLSALFAAVLAGAAARRYAGALRTLTETAERAARGERAPMETVETPREFARLGDAVHRLARIRNRTREPLPVGGARAD